VQHVPRQAEVRGHHDPIAPTSRAGFAQVLGWPGCALQQHRGLRRGGPGRAPEVGRRRARRAVRGAAPGARL